MSYGQVRCSVCAKEYLKDKRHINESKRLGHNLYCSSICFSKFKNKQIRLICENQNCSNIFYRSTSDLSFRNFCSTSCAMKIIGPENGLKHKKFRYCKYCGSNTRGSKKYCSMKCWGKDHEISREEIIKRLLILSTKLNRSPTRRECGYHRSCTKHFGSWNNALIAAGLEPNRSLNQKMYKRRKCFAKDGHICNSVSELIIDNWLFKNQISHKKEIKYPVGKFKADWLIENNVLVEYFGLAHDSKRYDEDISKKRLISKEAGIKLVEIYSKDIYPKDNLIQIFKEFL